MKDLKDFDFHKKTSEEKIEILDNMINKYDKKIKFREEFIPFSSLWVKVHLIIPIITLLGTITCCALPIPGLLESLYSYILFAWVYSLAILATCSVIIPVRFTLSNSLKKLENKNSSIKHLKDIIETELQQELSISKENIVDTNSHSLEEDMQNSYDLPTQFNYESLFDSYLNNDEQENNYNNELTGPRLVKKRIPLNNRYDK